MSERRYPFVTKEGLAVCGVLGEMTWPAVTGPQADLGWLCRYGSVEEVMAHRYGIASVIDAYIALVVKSQQQRNAVCREIRAASAEWQKERERENGNG